MNLTKRRERCREILEGDQCFHSASVYDPISARIAEDLGFIEDTLLPREFRQSGQSIIPLDDEVGKLKESAAWQTGANTSIREN